MSPGIAYLLAVVAVIVLAVWLRAPLRRLDDRALASKFGWLLPGGVAYKLGRRDRREGERWSAYLLGGGFGWLYNAGRVDARRDAAMDREDDA